MAFLVKKRIYLLAIFIVLIGSAVAFSAAFFIREVLQDKENTKFYKHSELVEQRLKNKVDDLDESLVDMVALSFSQNKTPSKELFKKFIDYKNKFLFNEPLEEGFGFLKYKKNVQADGIFFINEFFISLKSSRNEISKEALSSSESILALQKSMERGVTASTNRIVVNSQTKKINIFLIFHPLYTNGLVPKDINERKQKIIGWAYAFIDTDEIKKFFSKEEKGGFEIELYDSTLTNKENKLFGLLDHNHGAGLPSVKKSSLNFFDKSWTIIINPHLHTISNMPLLVALAISIGGTISSFLLALLLLAGYKTKKRASEIAREMTIDLNLKNDLLERSLLEARERRREIRDIVDSIPGFVSWFDSKLFYLGVNAELANLFNKRPDDFIGKELGYFYSQSFGSEAAMHKAIREFAKTTEKAKTVFHSMKLHDAEYHFVTTIKRVANDTKIIVVSIDVSEQHKLEKQLEIARIQTINASKMSALGEMAGSIAHEINNPLTIIYGNAKILLNKASKQETLEPASLLDATKLILKTTERISHIVRGLKTIARDGSGDPFVAINICSIISDTYELCLAKLKNHDIEFSGPALDKEIKIDCRPAQIMQALLNLINNAHDAVMLGHTKKISLEIKNEESSLILIVSDSGNGIAPALRDKILQPFFTTKEVGKGTGLGLSITKSIAESHGGSLTFTSEPSVGTKFYLKILKKHL